MGIGQIRVVRELTEAWETAVEEDRMGLVVIEGPTGIGKTAVVQALYGQLAMRQARPAYWPATFDAPDAAGIRNLGAAGSEDNGRPGPASASDGIVWRRVRSERIYPLDMAPAEGSARTSSGGGSQLARGSSRSWTATRRSSVMCKASLMQSPVATG